MHIHLSAPVILTLCVSATASAQVFNLGPSPSNLFDTVVNIPPNTAISSAGNLTQVNLDVGGTLTGDFHANSGSEINFVGGGAQRLYANAGSEVNFSGGSLSNLEAGSGSLVNFLGGGRSNSIFRASAGSVFNLFGSFEFRGLIIEADGQLNIYGSEFTIKDILGDIPLDNLTRGVPFAITTRGNVFLESVFPNGDSIAIHLGASVDQAATLTVTLIPTPSSNLLAIAPLLACCTGARRSRRAGRNA